MSKTTAADSVRGVAIAGEIKLQFRCLSLADWLAHWDRAANPEHSVSGSNVVPLFSVNRPGGRPGISVWYLFAVELGCSTILGMAKSGSTTFEPVERSLVENLMRDQIVRDAFLTEMNRLTWLVREDYREADRLYSLGMFEFGEAEDCCRLCGGPTERCALDPAGAALCPIFTFAPRSAEGRAAVKSIRAEFTFWWAVLAPPSDRDGSGGVEDLDGQLVEVLKRFYRAGLKLSYEQRHSNSEKEK